MHEQHEELIIELAKPLAASMGLVIWGVEVLGSSKPIVRIYLDVDEAASHKRVALQEDEAIEYIDGFEEVTKEDIKKEERKLPASVRLDECTQLSRLLSLSLDIEAPFAAEWTLEVSSPGLNRPFFSLEQLPPYKGDFFDVALADPMDTWPKRKKFSGTLINVSEETFSLLLESKSEAVKPSSQNSSKNCKTVGIEKKHEEHAEEVEIPWYLVKKIQKMHRF